MAHDDSTQVMSRVAEGPRAKLEGWERGAITLATAVLAFGGAAGNSLVALVGAAGLLAVVVVMTQMPARKARKLQGGGREFRTGPAVVFGVAWGLVMAAVGAILFLFPNGYAMTGGMLAAGVSAVIMVIALAIVDK